MLVRWHGHACFELVSSKGTVVVIDPHDGRSLGLKPPRVQADIVLITHEHFDHNAFAVVAKPGASVLSMRVGSEQIKDVAVKGVESYHDRERGRRRGRNVIYRVTVDGINFVHLGDLGHELGEEHRRELAPVDVLMVPVGGTFTVGPQEAWKVIDALKPLVVIPMHYWVQGLNLPLRPVEEFLDKAPAGLWKTVKVGGNEVELRAGGLEANTIYVLAPP